MGYEAWPVCPALLTFLGRGQWPRQQRCVWVHLSGPPAVIFLAPWEPVATLAVHGATPLPQGKGQGTPTPGDAMWKVIASHECPGHCLWLYCRSPAVRVHGTRLSVCWSWCFREPSVYSGKHALHRDLGLNVAVTDPQPQLGTTWASACAAAPFRPRGAALGSQMSSWHRQKCSQTPC